MNTKLTLTVEKRIIVKAKHYAKKTGRSLSELIENYLQSLVEEKGSAGKMSPKLKRITGAVKLPKDFNEAEELRSILEKKHL